MLDQLFAYVITKWDLISANPMVFVAVSLLSGICGYLLARWYYSGLRERIELFKDRNAELQNALTAASRVGDADERQSVDKVEPETIPIEKAARLAFDATRDTVAAEMAIKSGARTENIVGWYVSQIAKRTRVYGTWGHAATPALIDFRKSPKFFIGVRYSDGKAVVHGEGMTEATDIFILASDLKRAIDDLKEVGKDAA